MSRPTHLTQLPYKVKQLFKRKVAATIVGFLLTYQKDHQGTISEIKNYFPDPQEVDSVRDRVRDLLRLEILSEVPDDARQHAPQSVYGKIYRVTPFGRQCFNLHCSTLPMPT